VSSSDRPPPGVVDPRRTGVDGGPQWCEGFAAMSEKKNPVFTVGDYVVYPAHGVGRITGIEEQAVAGHKLEVFVIAFDQDKMTLRVPTSKVKTGGLRPLSGPNVVDDALKTLTGRARIKRAMWSRRAQEYEAKINSGDLISIAEVVRDLHRATDQPEQSYSERQLYESALDRMAREVAAIESVARDEAIRKLSETLASRAA
jgi:CarD family transcriptional regulator